MWRSIGDKFDYELHNERKHPRKVRTNIFLIIMLIMVFVTSTFTFSRAIINMTDSVEVYKIIAMTIYITCIIASLFLFVLKYLKNNREIDLALIVLVIFTVLAALNIR